MAESVFFLQSVKAEDPLYQMPHDPLSDPLYQAPGSAPVPLDLPGGSDGKQDPGKPGAQ